MRRFDRTRDSLPGAAEGAAVIVNGWNPPYSRWAAELPALTEEVIGSARASGALLIQPGNVYVYGPGAPAILTADTPHAATNPLGRLRIAIEARLRASGLPVVLLRAGDFIDTGASGNWLDRVILGKLSQGRLVYPGHPRVDYAWAFLPDLARAAVALAERGAPDGFEEVLFPGLTLSGWELLADVREATGRDIRLDRMPWWPFRLARPVWPMARGLVELRYLRSMPHRIDGAGFARKLHDFRETPATAAAAAAITATTGAQPSRFSMNRLQGRSS